MLQSATMLDALKFEYCDWLPHVLFPAPRLALWAEVLNVPLRTTTVVGGYATAHSAGKSASVARQLFAALFRQQQRYAYVDICIFRNAGLEWCIWWMHEIRRSKRHSYPSTYRTAWTRRLFPFFQPRTALSGLNRVIYAFSFPHGKDHPSIMDRSPISTRPGCGLCTYTPYPHLRLCMHHHISFRPKLAIVHSDIAGLQREATLAIYQPFCFSSIAVIISSIMSIS